MKYKKELLVIAAAAVIGVSAAAEAKNVRGGVVLPYTGGAAQFGQQIDRGMSLYLRLHGDQLGGHQIELIKRDSKRPGGDIAKTAVQELITREKVDLLTGFVFSPNAMASAPLVTQGKVPMVIMNAGTAWIPNLSPYIARVSSTFCRAVVPWGD